jgi:predicted RNase H-like HicB family nuclease
VGDYRVIYKVEGSTIYLLAVGHRKKKFTESSHDRERLEAVRGKTPNSLTLFDFFVFLIGFGILLYQSNKRKAFSSVLHKQILMNMQFSAVVTREGKLYVALCPEFDIASQGKTVESALKNLKEAIELYLEDEDAEVPERRMMPIVTSIEVGKVEASGGVGS